MLFKNIILTLLVFAVSAIPNIATAQASSAKTDADNNLSKLTIQENNFSCYQNLQCLKQNNPFKNSNLDEMRINSNRISKYVIEGSSRDEEIYAEYNRHGDLITATVIQRNIVLPMELMETLISDEFNSWKMIGNELVVEDFDKHRMRYKIILQKDDMTKIETFDRNGNITNQLL